jgi:hypothetical protein
MTAGQAFEEVWMSDLHVSFPKPCDESWEDMLPRGCNRHCASCDKIIHDLAALTFDEAAALLDTGTEVCVRAKVQSDGVIELKKGDRSVARRMVAAAGASFALATAACQTVPDTSAPRYQITGKFSWKDFYYSAELRSVDGQVWTKRREPGTGRFIFDGLAPGVYSLTVEDPCGDRVEFETVTITNSSVEVTQRYPESGCIIVGAMVKTERPERA